MPIHSEGSDYTLTSSDLYGGTIYINPSANINVTLPDAIEMLDVWIWNVSATFTATIKKPDATTLVAILPNVQAVNIITYIDSSNVPQWYAIPDNEVYGATWNGSLDLVTKDSVYDKIEAVVAASNLFEVYENQVEVTGSPFSGINFDDTSSLLATVVAAPWDSANVFDVSFALNLNNANVWTADQSVPDEAYGSGWNGSVEVPTKNAVYDQVELKATKVGLKLYIRDAAGTPHYWQVTVSTLGVLTTSDAGTTLPTDGIVIYA